MRPHDDELRLEEVDDQIDGYARAPRAGGWASPTARLIQDLHSLHANEQADAQSVDEVWQRMVRQGAVPSSPGERRVSSPPYQQSASQPPNWRAMSQPERRSPLTSRVTALVAAVVLVVLVGGLAVGLVLVRHQNSGISPQATVTPTQEAVARPSATSTALSKTLALAYIGKDGNVWTMTWPGGTPTQLTTAAHGPNTYRGLAWSPDGSMLAFVKDHTNGGSSSTIYVMQPDGTVVQMVIIPNLYGGVPFAWSPDSTMIAYRLGNNGSYYQNDGTFLGQLVFDKVHDSTFVKNISYAEGGSGCGGGGPLSDLNQKLWTVHHEDYGLNQGDIFLWSPDQQFILVGEDCDPYGPVGQVDLSTGKVNYTVPSEGGYEPGGNLIVGHWGDGTLGLTDLSGNHVRALAKAEPFVEPQTYMTLLGFAAWSSDGKTIYYEHDDGIGQVGVDGSNQRQILQGTALDSDENATMLLLPRPSPNGQFLLYLKVTGSNRVGDDGSGDPTPVATPTIPLTTRWYVAQADGTNPVALPQGVIDAVWN